MIPVLFVDSEIEAELAKGRLESEGIAARSRFSPKGAYPSYVVGSGGYGIGSPLSAYEVLVDESDADEARRILGAPSPRTRPAWSWRRQLLMVIALVYLVPIALALAQALSTLRLMF